MSQPWPPPPDLESIRQLVREADIEGFIASQGAPPDEYDTEAEELHAAIEHMPTSQIIAANLLPILEPIWRRNFVDDDHALAERRPALLALVEQIERFFGPAAQPHTR
jgi:hypothetical protein